jgi:hypothetical protein
MLLNRTAQVSQRTTLREFLNANLDLFSPGDGAAIDEETAEALAHEIWDDDANANVRRASGEAPRSHVPPSATTLLTTEVFPGEWIHLPAAESASPGWMRHVVDVPSGDVNDACTLVEEWATRWQATLPPTVGPTPATDTPTTSADTLESYLFNSLLRAGKPAKKVYFYAAYSTECSVDVPPATTSNADDTGTSAHETPPWLVRFWQYIDQVRARSQQHWDLGQHVHTILTDGRLVARVATILAEVVANYESDAPGSISYLKSFGAMEAYLTPNVSDLRAKIETLRSVTQDKLDTNAQFALLTQLPISAQNLVDFVDGPAAQALYADFSKARSQYPQTATAYQLATASYTEALQFDPRGPSRINELLESFMAGTYDEKPTNQEVAQTFSGKFAVQVTSTAASLKLLVAGNAPGPSSLWVSLTKLSLLRTLDEVTPTWTKAQKTAEIFQDIIERLMLADGIAPSQIKIFEQAAADAANVANRDVANAVIQRVNNANAVAASTHAGAGYMAALGVANLVSMLFACEKGFKEDSGADQAMDLANAANYGLNLGADVLAYFGTQAGSKRYYQAASLLNRFLSGNAPTQSASDVAARYAKLADRIGPWAARAAFILGLAAIAVEVSKGDKKDWGNIASGGGAMLQSVAYFLDAYATKRATLIALRVAAADGAASAAEAGGLVLMGDLLAFATVLNIVGIGLAVGALCYSHRAEILAILYDLATPGLTKQLDQWFRMMSSSEAVAVSDPSVKAAVDAAIAAAKSSTITSWIMPQSTIDHLKACGVSAEDITALQYVAVNLQPAMP